jgi:hypothetical protein
VPAASSKRDAAAQPLFCVIGNSSGISITQNAPRDAQLADKKIAYAILLARLSSATLTGRIEGMGESKSACGLCSGKSRKTYCFSCDTLSFAEKNRKRDIDQRKFVDEIG